MDKKFTVKPFETIYKVVSFIFNIPIYLIRYFCIGFFFTCYIFISLLLSSVGVLVKYAFFGFIFLSKGIYHFLFLAGEGVVFSGYLLFSLITSPFRLFRQSLKGQEEKKKQAQIKKKEAERIKQAQAEQKKLERLEKEKRLAEARKQVVKKEEPKKNKVKRFQKDEYKNETVKIERKSFSSKLNEFFSSIGSIPKKIKKSFSSKYNNLSLIKNKKNKQDLNRQALLIDFDGEDAKKSEKKIMYEYVGKNAEGKVTKGYFEAYSKVEVHSFLLSEGFEVYSIRTDKWIQLLHSNAMGSNTKIKTKDLIFFLTQLSTYIKAGIPLVDSLKILTRQYKNKGYQRVFRAIIYDLTMGESFSNALTKQGESFPKLLINMIKASEMTGELPEALDDMADYYTEADKTRKQMINAMIYPSLVFIVSIAVITFIMIYVVPKFVNIYESMDADQIPQFTRIVINVSAFLENNIIWIFIAFIVFVLVIRYLYRNVKVFKTMTQWTLMHLPVFGNVIIYNEVTMFTKTFSSLLKHNVFITDSMEILNKITDNEIYKMLIFDTINNLAKGEKISAAFKDHWAFPVPAYEMLVTGEKTGELPEMMGKVSSYYQEMHKNAVTRIKTFMEPALIIFLTVMVGFIVLAIIIPMFGMYDTMQGYE